MGIYLVRLFFPFVGYDSSMNVQFAHLLDLVAPQANVSCRVRVGARQNATEHGRGISSTTYPKYQNRVALIAAAR